MLQTITYLPIKEPKLTIAKDEIRIKLPENISDNDKIDIISFFNRVVTEIGIPERTLRGHYHRGGILMRYRKPDGKFCVVSIFQIK